MAFSLPDIPFAPQNPKSYRPAIGLIGCGAITAEHLQAYRQAGYNVTALSDIDREAADARRSEFYPNADIFTDYRDLLANDAVKVVDIATHPEIRAEIIETALLADKHVLSQKPFVLDLEVGQRLADLAAQRNRKLAVNQNGRWAPHFSYIRQTAAAGIIGEIQAVHFAVHWDHNWVSDTQFDRVKHLILYDFAIHWFDMLTCIMGKREATTAFATLTHSTSQIARPALLAQVLVEYDCAQASLVFDADTQFGKLDTTIVVGSEGTITSTGPDVNRQTVVVDVGGYRFSPVLKGRWFPDGFHGTMGELLRSIEENREPEISANENLRSLALCFAAVESAEQGSPVAPGSVSRLPNN
jgi:predicted dehydrogenase